ncbi:Phosphonate-transporting ATPase [Carbonactinospora thermoautotrophica]|uniref:Phosphonate-transporting ATPase n=2 Tax=Carbonactinospora thermoautotrophica TaxID=1469144 RepID=A0A132MMZ6_9ACTN|nr:Phosphonate-transporting ATPase [Carbonactinospora thermoautotrophica]
MSSSAKRARLRHEQIGFVFQDVNLIQHLSVRANLELAVGGDNLPRAIALLDEFGLPDVAKAKPTRLSLGEQQRVAVARALAKDSSVVLADEPTSSLDPGNRDAVLRALRSAADHGAGVVIVTHDQAVADWADRRLEIDPARGTLSGGGTT